MLEIKEGSNLAALKSNTFIGAPPKMTNSCIRFHGERNILVCEEGITLFNSTITFHGNNSIIFLRKNKKHLPRRPCLDWPVCNDFKGDTNRLRQHFSGNECSIQEKIEHNTVYAGNSCKRVCESCFWDESCVHTW